VVIPFIEGGGEGSTISATRLGLCLLVIECDPHIPLKLIIIFEIL
jgi:hypothetical protein